MWAPGWEFDTFMLIWDTFGHQPFTVRELANAVAKGKDQLRVALSRLVRRGWLVRLRRGRYLAKPLKRIVASLRLYSVAQNALRREGITSPTYIHGSVADQLASEASDIDLLLVSNGDWKEIERKLPNFHLTFVDPEYIRKPVDFSVYIILRRGLPLFSRLEIAQVSFDPRGLLEEAIESYKTARVDGAVYEPQLLDAAGAAAKYILYKSGMLPPTSSIGAIFELARVQEAYLKAFRALEAQRLEDAFEMVMEWAKRT